MAADCADKKTLICVIRDICGSSSPAKKGFLPRICADDADKNAMLRELINKPLLKRARTCESCGENFQCEIGLKGCWCTEIELSDEKRSALAEEYQDCLCRKCLEAVSQNRD